MRGLRAAGIAVLQVPAYAAAWVMVAALLRNSWGAARVEEGCLIGFVGVGFDAVRRARRSPSPQRKRLAGYVRQGAVPADEAERARLTQYVSRERRQWHPYRLTALVFVLAAVGGFAWAALAGGRARLWGAMLLAVWCVATLVVERIGVARLDRMERRLALS